MLRIVQTENGKLQGLIGRDPRITVFRGVPFAAPPVGELRWRAPQPAQSWEGVRRCTEYGDLPVQRTHPGTGQGWPTRPRRPMFEDYRMSEDCLYLNIYSPAQTAEDNLPVFCFFHGGGMQEGFAYGEECDGERMARRGVIVVTAAYRVGLFGFLAHPELSARMPAGEPVTNFGMQDQSMALHWLRRNIRAFGGDPDRITIAGQSAGAESVQVQLCSPFNEKGLIAGAVCQSSIQFDFGDIGSGIKFIETLPEAEARGAEFFRRAGISGIDQARKIDALELMRLVAQMDGDSPMGYAFGVSVDGRFLPCTLSEAYFSGRMADVPMMVGVTRGELHGLFPVQPVSYPAFLRRASVYGEKSEEFLRLAGVKNSEDATALYASDVFNPFFGETQGFCELRSSAGHPVWFYLFDHEMPGDDAGSYHGSEIPFVFDNLANSWRPFEGRHYDLARQVCSYWANFTRAGDPNGQDLNGAPLPAWQAYRPECKHQMVFRAAPEPTMLPDSPILNFRLAFGKARHAAQ